MTTDLQTYKAEYCWTEQEYVKSTNLNRRVYLRPSIVRAANITALFLIAISTLIWILNELNSSAGFTLLVTIAACLCWFLRDIGINYWHGRTFHKRLDANVVMQWEFTVDTVKTHCENLSSGSVNWKLIKKLVETKDGFLFYVNEVNFLWLPLTAFEEQEGIKMVREFAKINGVQYVQTKG